MDPDGSSFLQIILLLILLILNAFFSMSEMALISLNDAKVSKLSKEGDKKAKKIQRLLKNPSDFLSTIQVGVTLSNLLASAVAASTFAAKIVLAFSGKITFIKTETFYGIAVFVITVLLSYVTLVFGELVPKRVAMNNPERISFAVIGPLGFITKFLKPVVRLLSSSTNLMLRILRIDPDAIPEEATEEEIRMMLDVGGERGDIEEIEKHMIHNIFEFDDRHVEEIMTHRTEIIAVEIGVTLEKILEIASEYGYSRIPVYEEDLDDIKGLIYVKDLLQFVLDKDCEFNIYEYLRDPLFVIETNTCSNLLSQFQETKIQLAVVVDEYGGTAGLVTMEDLLEAIVGNIQDEYDDEEEDISQISDDSYLVDGLTSLDDFVRFFEIKELPGEDDFDTIGGYILSEIGQIPNEYEQPSVQVLNFMFTIKEMDERRIAKLLVEVLEQKSDSESDPSEQNDEDDNE